MSLQRPDPARVLVVEDDEETGRLVHRLLVRDGYDAHVVADAAQAIDALDAHEPALLLCDIRLPGASGLDLARHVQASHPATAVLMVSGIDERDIAEHALALGAYGYITKPFTPTQLVIGVANALRRRSLELESSARRAELEQTVRARTADLRRSHEETVRRLAWAAEFRDPDTGRHLERMGRLCELVAARAGLDREQRELIRAASPLHDVGKIGIPDSILLKPGPLTAAEQEVMRMHAEIGRQLLSGSGATLLDLAAEIAWTHHERVDGTGYPRGLAGDDIPLEGRIAAVADVFDALTSDRVYRAAHSVEEAIEIMRAERGTHLDARLLDLFLDSIDEVLAIASTSSPVNPLPLSHP